MADDKRAENIAACIARATKGEESAQRLLYEMHHAAAFRLTCLLLQDTCDAEEVVQDAFVYLFRNLDRYDPNRGGFWTWLRVILVSRCRNKRRRKRLSLVSLEALERDGISRFLVDPKPDGDPVRWLEVRGTRREIWEALQQVSQGSREALVLRYYGGLPYAEIGVTLGCSAAAARARVAHGKAQLRRLLAAREEPAREGSAVPVAGEVG